MNSPLTYNILHILHHSYYITYYIIRITSSKTVVVVSAGVSSDALIGLLSFLILVVFPYVQMCSVSVVVDVVGVEVVVREVVVVSETQKQPTWHLYEKHNAPTGKFTVRKTQKSLTCIRNSEITKTLINVYIFDSQIEKICLFALSVTYSNGIVVRI